MPRITLDDLHTALKLFDTTLTEWHKTLKHPETGDTISRSAVYMALEDQRPQWILDEVTEVIHKSRKQFPDYYRHRQQQPQ